MARHADSRVGHTAGLEGGMRMTQPIARWADRLLGRLLTQTDAGACAPNYNQFCGCTSGFVRFEKRYNCLGVCTKTQNPCDT